MDSDAASGRWKKRALTPRGGFAGLRCGHARVGRRGRSATPTGRATDAEDNGRSQLVGLPAGDYAPPAQISFPPVEELAPGDGHTCGVTAAGAARCWGYNSRGQAGSIAGTVQSSPTPIQTPRDFVQLSAGASFTCGVTAQAGVQCWGDGSHGQLGSGVQSAPSPQPVDVSIAASVKAITTSVGRMDVGPHACALTVDGRAFCWGANDRGQLGDGSIESVSGPVEVAQ